MEAGGAAWRGVGRGCAMDTEAARKLKAEAGLEPEKELKVRMERGGVEKSERKKGRSASGVAM